MSTTISYPSNRRRGGQPEALIFEVMDHLIIVVHGHGPPADAAWYAYLDVTLRARDLPHLVVTGGGAPTVAQRRAFREVCGDRPRRIAVVSASSHIACVVTAVRWFNEEIRLFYPESIEEALVYVGTPSWRRRLVKLRVRALQQVLGVKPDVL